jgi:hypothetical protein
VDLTEDEQYALRMYFSRTAASELNTNHATQSSYKLRNVKPYQRKPDDRTVHEANDLVHALLSEYKKSYVLDVQYVKAYSDYARPFDIIAGGYRGFRWLELLIAARYLYRSWRFFNLNFAESLSPYRFSLI